MFGNRELRIRTVKTDGNTSDPQTLEMTHPLVEMLKNIDYKEVAITTSICVAGIVLSVGMTHVIEETLIHTAKTKIK